LDTVSILKVQKLELEKTVSDHQISLQ